MGGGFLSSLSTPWTPSAPPKQGSSGNTWPFSPLFIAYSNYGRRASTERNSSNAKRNFGTILIRSYKLSIRYTVVQLLRSAEINTGQQLFQTEPGFTFKWSSFDKSTYKFSKKPLLTLLLTQHRFIPAHFWGQNISDYGSRMTTEDNIQWFI